MTKKIDSESSKTVSEFTHIQRWEDDGGAVSEVSHLSHPVSRVVETNIPPSVGIAKNDPLYVKQNNDHPKGDKPVNPFVFFLASNTGRTVRIIGGLALVVLGRFGFSGMTALVVVLIGTVPLLAGTFDLCVFAPLFDAPLTGPKIRAGSS